MVDIKEIRKKARAGDAAAQCLLGHKYEIGEGVWKNPVQAAQWYRKAAEQGDAAGQNNLGACYASGCGVAKNIIKAARLYDLAASQGHKKALLRLFILHGNIIGDEKLMKAVYNATRPKGRVPPPLGKEA